MPTPAPQNLFERGSIWRKWDLHVHSPASALNNQFAGSTPEEKWNNYFAKLASLTDFSVIGITDYFSIEGYLKVLAEATLPNVDLILPNVELRILPVTGTETPINLHIIFDPSVVPDLDNRFFSNLKYSYVGDDYKCTRGDLIKLGRKFRNNPHLEDATAYRDGIEQFKTDIQSLREILRTNKMLADKSIIVVSNSSNDGNSGIQHSSLAATREEIYRAAHGIFSGNPSDARYFLGYGTDSKKEVIRKYGSLKPCIHGCDAHSLDTIGKPCSKRADVGHNCATASDCEMRFCWVKADPTFEGLKQIVYEPEERVRIKDRSPYEDRKKVFFENLQLEGSRHFILPDTTLPLNRELITVIGGRGSGKSALLETIAFLNEEHLKVDLNGKKKVIEFYRDNESRSEPPPSFLLKVTLEDKDGQKQEFKKSLVGDHESLELPFLYLGQEQLSGMATNDQELLKTICELIGIDAAELNQQELVIKGRDLLAKMSVGEKTTKDIVSAFRRLGYPDGQDLEKWTEEYVKKLSAQEARLSSKETSAALTEINKKTQEGLKLKDLVGQADLTIASLEKLDANESIADLEKKIKALYPDVKFDLVDTKKQIEEIKAFQERAKADMDRLRSEIRAQKAELIRLGIKEDVNTLLQSSEALQRQIGAATKDLENYRLARLDIARSKRERDTLMASIRRSLNQLREQISSKFTDFQNSRNDSTPEEKELFEKMISGINIDGQIVFDDRRLCETLLSMYVDNRRLKNVTDLKKQIAGENRDGTPRELTIEALEEWVRTDFASADIFNRGGEDGAREYILTQWPNFLRVKAVVRLNGKALEILSIGQRGTLLLKVYLSTATARQIFIIDQPEDNLDNNFIMNELVPLILKTKKSRQILMSTHNANLVVNADAEQVIVARLDLPGDKPYFAGSIENPEINQSIRDILEGGEEAFRQRERKYQMNSA
jgi:ABC-type cobalamin/Fe3+-siderophores transport system ATPase subunit